MKSTTSRSRPVRPPRGCDAALRPRGRAVGGPCEAQVAHRTRTRGRRPRERPCGAPRGKGGRHMEGPWVSGPWLEVWGGNANALPRPDI